MDVVKGRTPGLKKRKQSGQREQVGAWEPGGAESLTQKKTWERGGRETGRWDTVRYLG